MKNIAEFTNGVKQSILQKPRFSPAEECMQNIVRATNGGQMSSAQRHVFEACRRMVTPAKPIWGNE